MSQIIDDRRVLDATDERRRAARRMVVRNPRVLGGEPCIRGTRVPVYMIAELVAAVGIAETHDTYPFLSVEQIELASVYSLSNPRRRPPKLTVFPPQKGSTRRISVKRVDE